MVAQALSGLRPRTPIGTGNCEGWCPDLSAAKCLYLTRVSQDLCQLRLQGYIYSVGPGISQPGKTHRTFY